jgi:hypothetical protein
MSQSVHHSMCLTSELAPALGQLNVVRAAESSWVTFKILLLTIQFLADAYPSAKVPNSDCILPQDP